MLRLILFFVIIGSSTLAHSQSKKHINIEQADKMQFNKNVVQNANRLLGNVKITHEDVVMFCDSAYSYTDTNMIDAFGHVHIIKADTLDMYANFINYNGDTQWSLAKGNVKLINDKTTLTTERLDYDMQLNVGYYDNYGTVIDSLNTLTSIIGEYYANLDKIYFKTKVDANTPGYRMLSDTLIYEPSTGIATITGPTTCFNETDTLYAVSGFYNTNSGYSELHNYPIIKASGQDISAESVFIYQQSGDGLAIGNASIHDIEQKTIVKGNRIKYNSIDETSLVTDSAHILFYSNVDTLFMYADTLFTRPDTIPNEKVILGYHAVQFFREDLQGKCDSMAYFTVDSTLCLHHSPVVWSQSNQLSADYMEMLLIDSLHQEFHLEKNAFIISQEDSIRFNQIKGRDMIGHISNRDLHRIDVDGNGQSLYYARDSKGLIGLNKALGSKIRINLQNSQVTKIAFLTKPDGQLIPPNMASDSDSKLSGFEWYKNLRPKCVYDIFSNPKERKRSICDSPTPILPPAITPIDISNFPKPEDYTDNKPATSAASNSEDDEVEYFELSPTDNEEEKESINQQRESRREKSILLKAEDRE